MKSDERSQETLGVAGLKQRLEAVGWAELPRLAEGENSESVAAQMGDMIDPWDGPLVQRLTPKAASTPNTYSGIFGLGRFPFHTDLAHWRVPPRYLLLRCVRGYADVPTMLLDGFAIAAAVGWETTARALMKPRRPQAGEVRLLRLSHRGGEDDIIRWDPVFLKPASRVGELALERIQAQIETAVPKPVTMVDDGDVLIVDNWRMLHARPAIPENRRDRCLERVYLRQMI